MVCSGATVQNTPKKIHFFAHNLEIKMRVNNVAVAHLENQAAPPAVVQPGPNRGPVGGGVGRRRCRDWCFTWNNYSEGERAYLRAMGESDQDRIQYLVYGREVGASGTPHLQGFIQLKRPLSLQSVHRLLCPIPRPGNHVHLEERVGTVEQATNYAKKDGDFREFGTPSLGAGNRNDLRGFVDYVRENGALSQREMALEFPEIMARHPRWVEQVFAAFEEPPAFEEHPLRPWQQDLQNMLEADPDPRKVIFVVDYQGDKGKSWFIEHFERTHDDVLTLMPAKFADMAYVFANTRPRPRVVFIDCPREKLDFFSYTFLEKLKDGRFLSTKYETKLVRFARPHVVVMMNDDPIRAKMSNDRFIVMNLTPQGQPVHYFPEDD